MPSRASSLPEIRRPASGSIGWSTRVLSPSRAIWKRSHLTRRSCISSHVLITSQHLPTPPVLTEDDGGPIHTWCFHLHGLRPPPPTRLGKLKGTADSFATQPGSTWCKSMRPVDHAPPLADQRCVPVTVWDGIREGARLLDLGISRLLVAESPSAGGL